MQLNRVLRSSELRTLVALVTVVVGSYLAGQLVVAVVDPHGSKVSADALEVVAIVLLSTTGLWWMVIRGLREQHRRQNFDQQV